MLVISIAPASLDSISGLALLHGNCTLSVCAMVSKKTKFLQNSIKSRILLNTVTQLNTIKQLI